MTGGDRQAIPYSNANRAAQPDRVRHGDLSPTMYNPNLVEELKAMKEASWLSYMFDS